MSVARLVVVAVITMLVVATRADAQTSYTFTTIIYPNSILTEAFGINDSGEIAGTYIDSQGVFHGFTYNASTAAFTSVTNPNQIGTVFFGINDNGQIIGESDGAYFIYSGSSFDALSSFPAGDEGEADGINDSDQIVGFEGEGGPGFLYDSGQTTIIRFPGALDTEAFGINDSGQIVGWYALPNSPASGFSYSGGTFTTINDSNELSTALLAISNNGEMVGFYSNGIGAQGPHAISDSNGVFSSAEPPDATNSYATGVNDAGQVVGYYISSVTGETYGFLATPGSTTAPVIPPKTLGDPFDCPGGCSVGHPINVGTGNMFEQATDYETAGQNKLAFSRYYNSLAAPSTFAAALGSHWRSIYDRYLNVGTSTVIAERPDGQQLTFTLSGSRWTPDTDVDYTLTNTGTTWTLTDHNDTVETYSQIVQGTLVSSEALLNSVATRNGYTQTLAYNANNQLTTVTDSYKRSLAFIYNGTLLNTVTTPDGLILTYGYNSSGITPGVNDRLASVSYSTSPVTSQSYVYENAAVPFGLIGIIDEDGNRYATWSYDIFGRGLTSEHGTGADLTTISYDDTTGNRTVTNALGEQEVYQFTTLQGVPKVTEIDRLASTSPAVTAAQRLFTYDVNGYIKSQTDWNGNLTNYTNDAHGDPLVINEAVGTKQARTTKITYDTPDFVHLPAQIVTPELTTSYSYDGNGNPLTKTLADTTTQKKPYSTKGQSRTWTYTWSDFLLGSAETPLKDLTQFSYDGTGALSEITNALGQKTQITAHLPGGLPETIIDPNGVVTNLAYDPRQRLLSSAITTSAGVLTTAFAYDAAGNLITVTLPDGSALTDSYDAAHRLIGIADLFNNSIAYTLDGLGDRTLTQVENSSSAVTQQHSGIFDALGRVLQDIGGVGQTTSYTYDNNGNAVSITDPLTHVTQQAFDALNRLSQVTQPSPVGGTIVTTYDAHDRPLTVTDPDGNVTSYVYDGFGDVIEQTSPDSGTTLYYYDADGNLTKEEDADKVVTTYSYDALDRVLTTRYPADSTENVAYTYDQSGHGFGTGRLTSLTDAAGTLSRSYDERGNILNETRQTQGQSLSTSYAYDAASRVAAITYPDSAFVAYSRDSMGRITTVSVTPPASSAATVLSSINYEPFGPVTSLTFGNGIVETRSFDLDYRMTNLADAGTTTLQNLSYVYDQADNVRSITDGVTPGNSQAFPGYDALNRMTGATGGYGSLAYTYDPVGNILSQTLGSVATKYTYAKKSNRLAGIVTGKSKQSVGSTAAGNIDRFKPALGSVTTLTYNKANRLETLKAKLVSTYTYDAFGQRLVKSAFNLTLFGYDLSGHLLEENTGGTATDYIYLDGRPVATLTPSTGALAFLLDDRLGTPQLASDNSQSTVWAANYQPYGLTGTITGSATQNLRLPGQYADAESGFNYNYFRDYMPELGRYLENDPIGIAGGSNVYLYADANPFANADRIGLAVDLYYGATYKSWEAWFVNEPSYFTVLGEGSSTGSFNYLDPYGSNLSASDLAWNIYTNPNYKAGMRVRIYACNAGVGGHNSFAAQVAESLNAMNAGDNAPLSVVFGPNGYISPAVQGNNIVPENEWYGGLGAFYLHPNGVWMGYYH